MTNSPLRLIAYIRVSGKSQIDGYGPDIQMTDITNAAERLGAVIVKTCYDLGEKGTVDALDREGLACAIDGVRADEADGIIVGNLTRLARALTVQEAALALVWQAGGRVFSADTGEIMADDPDDPMRTAIRQILGVMAQLDRATIALRLRKGRQAKAAAGGYAGGTVPFGKACINGDLVDVTDEQGVIVMINEWRRIGMSLREISNRLNEMCITTKQGKAWQPETVRRNIWKTVEI